MNQSFRTALKEGDEPAWVSRQKKVFTSWINLRIKGRDIAPVEDIFEDLKSGFVLYHLFEVLSGTSLRPLGTPVTGEDRAADLASSWRRSGRTTEGGRRRR